MGYLFKLYLHLSDDNVGGHSLHEDHSRVFHYMLTDIEISNYLQ